MSQDSDGIDEALQGVSQVAMTAAGRLGEQLARELERQSREAQARSEQSARELAARMEAEQAAARATLVPVTQDQWWDAASGEDITRAYTTARAWSDLDPQARAAEERIVREVRDRYGIDVSDSPDQAAVSEAIERAERARAEAAEQRTSAQGDRAEAVALTSQADTIDSAAEATLVLNLSEGVSDESARFVDQMRQEFGIDVLDPSMDDKAMREQVGDAAREQYAHDHGTANEVRQDAGAAYDSAERREALATSLDGIENQAAVDARLRSDLAQGRPATEAVAQPAGQTAMARKSPQSVQSRQVQRPARGR